ncbi:MAG: TRAP transporter TAXI family solute receptor [Candidatus Deianiraeaceae bacterium]|jgi:TRAP transporter TAXI family solute receptor
MLIIRVILIVVLTSFQAYSSEIITIATGSTTGLYYASAGAMCRVFNLLNHEDTRCMVESTPGSEYNINAVEGGLNNFALVQADELLSYLEKQGDAPSSIKVVFPFYTETFTMMVAKDVKMNSFYEMQGKNLNIGVEGSGVRNFTTKILKHIGAKGTDLKNIFIENQSSVEHLLCSGTVDVSIIIGGQPSNAIKNLVENCGAKIIPFPQDFINKAMKGNSFYSLSTIPAGMYYGYNKEMYTLGTRALLITSKYTDDIVVYHMVQNILQNFESFRQYSPVTARMSVHSISTSIPNLPVHQSAVKAFTEAGVGNNL